jgi:hypothetical protein
VHVAVALPAFIGYARARVSALPTLAPALVPLPDEGEEDGVEREKPVPESKSKAREEGTVEEKSGPVVAEDPDPPVRLTPAIAVRVSVSVFGWLRRVLMSGCGFVCFCRRLSIQCSC